MAKDYYKVLGVRKKASDADIKSAYRKLARKYHPDVNPGDSNAEKRFKEISEAYHVLGDAERRKKYDTYGTIDPSQFSGGGGAGGGQGGFGFSGFDFSKSGGSTNFGDIFEEIFGGKRKQSRASRPKPQKGQDLQYVMNLSFMDALKGITTEITVSRQNTCSTCRGNGTVSTGSTRTCRVCGGSGKKTVQSGMLNFAQDCYACGGSGVQEGETCRSCAGSGQKNSRDTINVRIPAGVEDGSRVRVGGKGNAGVRGGPSGDLFIITRVEPHPVFTRKGSNIYVTVPITASEAALGSKIEVPTIEGTATIRIPPATQTGQRFRLRERGAPALRGGKKGDQYVEVKITMPDIIDEDAKEIYRKLRATEKWNPRKELFEKI